MQNGWKTEPDLAQRATVSMSYQIQAGTRRSELNIIKTGSLLSAFLILVIIPYSSVKGNWPEESFGTSIVIVGILGKNPDSSSRYSRVERALLDSIHDLRKNWDLLNPNGLQYSGRIYFTEYTPDARDKDLRNLYSLYKRLSDDFDKLDQNRRGISTERITSLLLGRRRPYTKASQGSSRFELGLALEEKGDKAILKSYRFWYKNRTVHLSYAGDMTSVDYDGDLLSVEVEVGDKNSEQLRKSFNNAIRLLLITPLRNSNTIRLDHESLTWDNPDTRIRFWRNNDTPAEILPPKAEFTVDRTPIKSRFFRECRKIGWCQGGDISRKFVMVRSQDQAEGLCQSRGKYLITKDALSFITQAVEIGKEVWINRPIWIRDNSSRPVMLEEQGFNYVQYSDLRKEKGTVWCQSGKKKFQMRRLIVSADRLSWEEREPESDFTIRITATKAQRINALEHFT